MRRLFQAAVWGALIVCSGNVAWAAASADKRPPGMDTMQTGQNYCVKNAESGACQDCWSGAKSSSKGGTCKELKEATTNPNVRMGSCSKYAHIDFCKSK